MVASRWSWSVALAALLAACGGMSSAADAGAGADAALAAADARAPDAAVADARAADAAGADADTVAPIATLRAGDLVLTAAQQGIVIRYSESMLESSLVLGGSLAAAVRPIWSGFMAPDDTLEIPAPAGGWTDGGTLTVDATDPAGNAANRMSFSVKLSP